MIVCVTRTLEEHLTRPQPQKCTKKLVTVKHLHRELRSEDFGLEPPSSTLETFFISAIRCARSFLSFRNPLHLRTPLSLYPRIACRTSIPPNPSSRVHTLEMAANQYYNQGPPQGYQQGGYPQQPQQCVLQGLRKLALTVLRAYYQQGPPPQQQYYQQGPPM